MQPSLVYLHGFNSSAASAKACQLGAYLAVARPDIQYRVPTLPDTPTAAWHMICSLLETLTAQGPCGLIGSSLGGFWATCAAERFHLPAVLVNPAVHPQQLLQHYLGEQINPYTGVRYLLEPQHMAELAALDSEAPSAPERLWLLQQAGDEVLDYRQAVDYYRACPTTLEAGGCHAFNGFERYCPEIVRFLQL